VGELKILLLEDAPSDAELLERSLCREGLIFTALRVDTEPAFQQALNDFKPDIVLADYSLPSYNGRAALDYVQRAYPDIPVVMVTGAIGEEGAVELLTAGAKDYILKDRLARLPAAVRRVLAEQQEVQRRREAEGKFRKISEAAQDAIIMMGQDQRISFWNAAAERVFGYTAAEALGQELHSLITLPAAQAAFAHSFQHFRESGEGSVIGKVIEVTALRKGGEEFPAELSISATQLDGQWHAIGIVRDITERKRTEAALARHAFDLGERVKEIGCLSDITSLLLNKEGSMEQVLDACVRRMPAAWFDPSHTCVRIRLGEQTFESANFRETEWKLAAAIPMSDMETGLIEVFYFGAVTGDGKSPFLDEERALIQSISIQIAQSLENRLAEKALRESEQNYRTLSDSAPALIWASGNDKLCNYFNQPWLKFTGRTLEQELGNGWAEGVYPDDFAQCLATYVGAFDRREPFSMEYRLRRHDGEFRWMRDDGCPRYDINGNFIGYIGYLMDITERKRAEIELNHSNRALATLGAVNRNLVRVANEGELLHAVCQAIVEQGGYRMAWVGYKQHDENKSVKIVASAGHEEGYLDIINVTWAETERGMGPTGRAIRSGTTQLCQDFANDPRHLPWREAALERGYAASIALPLANGEVFGALTVYAEEVNTFTPGEVGLLEEMANDLAFGVRALHTRQERDLALQQSQQHLEQLQDSLEDSVRAIAGIVEMRDPYTAGHQVRVADLAAAIAKQMGLPDEQIHGIHLAGIVHDLGKIQVPAEILSKPGKISDIEYRLIKIHAQAGYDILKDIDFPWPIAQMVLQHHERLDGSGYPKGLKGNDILIEARILSVADVVEAMSSHRPYRAGLGIEAALEEITRQRGIHFDPQVVDACLAVFREQGYSFEQARMNP